MDKLLGSIIAIAKQAGQAINTFYQAAAPGTIQLKPDQSPLTQADLAANHIITQALQQLTPAWPILSEEAAAVPFDTRSQWQCYWLVDPLDGTKEFLEKNDEFTVNIALIKDNYPILGVVYAPALAICYYADAKQGAFKQNNNQSPEKIHTRKSPAYPINIAISRHHGQDALSELLKQFPTANLMIRGSALKFCLVAEGLADLYPRLSPTSEWDTAAAQCILEQAGGAVLTTTGQRFCYNKKDLTNPSFLAVGDPEYDWKKYLK